MKLGAEGGLWSTGSVAESVPLVAVLEVSGAVLSWVVDGDPAAAPSITFTDPNRADWLWRVLGEAGHVAVVDALRYRDPGSAVEVAGVEVRPGTTEALRRLALGHWLRRWWPASDRDAIAAPDRALLDAEIALLTIAAEDYFSDDTLDSDVPGLLAPHIADLNAAVEQGDPRTQALVRECRELAAELGLHWTDAVVAPARRDDYALAAGTGGAAPGAAAIASGGGSVGWSVVPPGVFDAAENTIDWTLVAGDSAVSAVLHVALVGPDSPAGIEIALRADGARGSGLLDAAGRAVLALMDADGRPLTETQAWNTDWTAAAVWVGVDTATESAAARDRVRSLARARLARPGVDAFLAEVLAAESDY